MLLRVLEKLTFLKRRQPFHVGFLAKDYSVKEISSHLETHHGFEPAILAWIDPGESLSMRKLDNGIYQYHVRIFSDGEVRCHYEFSSEGNPLGHVLERHFEPRTEEFTRFLEPFLVQKQITSEAQAELAVTAQ
jgi:hypothetical protein